MFFVIFGPKIEKKSIFEPSGAIFGPRTPTFGQFYVKVGQKWGPRRGFCRFSPKTPGGDRGTPDFSGDFQYEIENPDQNGGPGGSFLPKWGHFWQKWGQKAENPCILQIWPNFWSFFAQNEQKWAKSGPKLKILWVLAKMASFLSIFDQNRSKWGQNGVRGGPGAKNGPLGPPFSEDSHPNFLCTVNICSIFRQLSGLFFWRPGPFAANFLWI